MKSSIIAVTILALSLTGCAGVKVSGIDVAGESIVKTGFRSTSQSVCHDDKQSVEWLMAEWHAGQQRAPATARTWNHGASLVDYSAPIACPTENNYERKVDVKSLPSGLLFFGISNNAFLPSPSFAEYVAGTGNRFTHINDAKIWDWYNYETVPVVYDPQTGIFLGITYSSFQFDPAKMPREKGIAMFVATDDLKAKIAAGITPALAQSIVATLYHHGHKAKSGAVAVPLLTDDIALIDTDINDQTVINRTLATAANKVDALAKFVMIFRDKSQFSALKKVSGKLGQNNTANIESGIKNIDDPASAGPRRLDW